MDIAQAANVDAASKSREIPIRGVSRQTVLIVLTLTALMSSLDRQVLAMLIEPIRKEFDLSDTQLGLLSGPAFYALQAGLALPLAMLAERTSRKAVIAFSLAFFSAMTAVCGVALSFPQLLASRMGVAIGEAGTGPSSQAILADLYPKHELTRAMSIFFLSGTVGGFVAYLLGGFFSHWFGWRVTFLTLGIPGLALALVCYAVLPPADARPVGGKSAHRSQPSLFTTAAFLLSQPTLVKIVLGYALWSSVNAGLMIWVPAFATRVFGLPQSTLGVMMASIIGVGGGIGLFTIGRAASRLETRDSRWILWLVTAVSSLSLPLAWLAFLSNRGWVALTGGICTAFLTISLMGPIASMIQRLMPRPMRSVATALTSLVVTAVGASSGPLCVGIISDALSADYGAGALRLALALYASLWLVAALLFWSASDSLSRDLARADAWAPVAKG